MNKQYVYFEELPLKTEFHLNGNTYRKRSSRTADLPEYNRWFYFGRRELVIVGTHDRIEE